MTSDVNLRDTIGWHMVYVDIGIEVVVLRRDVNVIYIKQYAAISLLNNLVEELPFRHLGDMKLRITADIFDRNRHLKKVLGLSNLFCSVTRRLEGIGHRK